MMQIVESVDTATKINDKIMQIENRRHTKFTPQERKIAYEMFMSGFLFSSQWYGDEFLPVCHSD